MKRFNEWLSVKGTIVFGSMYTCYLFFFYGFLPIIFPQYMNQLLYWSNTVQLWSLPLLMCGQVVIGRAAEKQNNETHAAVMEELQIAKEERQELTELVKYLHEKLERNDHQ